ncbi:MAG TPA: hypothetical protein VJ228_05285 [Candidatus Acidoferrales bacterium]|nr:hypothetical protein [Candidatus Acidoferrales bacterium]
MTLLFAVLHLAVVLLIFLVATAWGYRVLEVLGCEAQSNLETVLFAFAALEIVLFVLAFAGWLRWKCRYVARMALKKQKARLSAGLRGEKAPRPLRGRPQNPFLDRSLVRAKEISQAGKTLFDSVVSQ